MKNIYLSSEIMGTLVILILLYACIFETKQRTKKRRLFIWLLLSNGAVVAADMISWLKLGWDQRPELLALLVGITYIMPCIMQAIFAS